MVSKIGSSMIISSVLFLTSILIMVSAEDSGDDPFFEERSAIMISGNGDLINENGVVSGSGVKDDLFLITGWWINASGEEGITIIGTDMYVHIYSVAVTHALNMTDPFNVSVSGIRIIDCENIRVERAYIYYFNTGLEVISSKNIDVHDSSFIENNNGILMEADGSSVTGCICSYNTVFGLFINNSRDLLIRDILSDANSFTVGEGSGIQLYNCSDIVLEECYGTLNYGGHISVIGSLQGIERGRSLIIRDCYSDSNIYGIQIVGMDLVRVSNSRIRGNMYGIYLGQVSYAEVRGSHIYKNSYGMVIYETNSSLISYCDLDRNDKAMTLDSSSGNRVLNNVFFNSTEEAVKVLSTVAVAIEGNPNEFIMNEFIDNNGNGEQVKDATGTVEWSEDGIGNTWSDWQGPDLDGNGIVDVPKDIHGGARDDHPLVNATYRGSGVIDQISDVKDEDDDRSMEYWILISMSALATLFLGLIMVYNRRTSDRS